MTTRLSERIKKTETPSQDVTAITEKLDAALNLDDDKPTNKNGGDADEVTSPDDEEEEWEKLADKELNEPSKPTPPESTSSPILELYDFDPRLQMHQLVKELTNIIDPTGTMPFRPKMVNQSLFLTFNNPKHATTALYNYSCITPQDPIGKLRRSDGVAKPKSASTNILRVAPPSPSRIRPSSPASRPLTTDTVARRFIAGHLGIRATTSPERREYDKLVRTQALQQKEERDRQKRKEEEDQKRQLEELKDVWERG